MVLDENQQNTTGQWLSPWRVVIVGELKDVVASTLVTDVSDPCRIEDTSWIKPGSVSWIYWAYNHGSNDYQIVRKYVDMAVEMHWPYVLIDAEWDEMKNGGNIEDAIRYAHDKGVKPILWYNSSTAWIKAWGAPGPHERLNAPENREREFVWLENMGRSISLPVTNRRLWSIVSTCSNLPHVIILWSTSMERQFREDGREHIQTS